MADITKINRPLTRENVRKAHELIKPYIHLTPVTQCDTLSSIASTPQHQRDPSLCFLPSTPSKPQPNGTTPQSANPQLNIYLKLENQQKIGAFKARGAFHALSRLTDGELESGVTTHSSGNHAQALALAARTRRIPAYIVMPSISTPSKIAGTKAQGAQVFFSGSTEPERERLVEQIQGRTGAVLVPPCDHPDIMLGQGTVGLEFESQVKELEQAGKERAREQVGHGWRVPRRRFGGVDGGGEAQSEGLDAVIAPCGGGGLLSGIATALAGTGILVYGAEPQFQGADDCARGLAADPPERVKEVSTRTIADGLRTPVGVHPWGVISDREKVRGVYTVSEEEIKAAMRLLYERAKVVAEPSGAVALAMVLFNEEWRREAERASGGQGWKLGVVVSGGNTTMEALAGLFGEEKEERKIWREEGMVEGDIGREELRNSRGQ